MTEQDPSLIHFAILDTDSVVVNILLAKTLEDAVAVADVPAEQVIECPDINSVSYPVGEVNRSSTPQIGGKYNADLKKFIPQQPYPSWSLDSKGDWQPPIAKPSVELDPDTIWTWQEESNSWVPFTLGLRPANFAPTEAGLEPIGEQPGPTYIWIQDLKEWVDYTTVKNHLGIVGEPNPNPTLHA